MTITTITLADEIVAAFNTAKLRLRDGVDADRRSWSTDDAHERYMAAVGTAVCYKVNERHVFASVGDLHCAVFGHIAAQLLDSACDKADVDGETWDTGLIEHIRPGMCRLTW